MKQPPAIRTLAAEEWRLYRDLRLRSLAESPNAFARTLAEAQINADRDCCERLRAAAGLRTDLPLVAEHCQVPIGLAWGRIEPTAPAVAALYGMWVDPGHRGIGAGRLLLAAVVDWARSQGATALGLGVTCGESSARRLYERAGFTAVGEPEPLRPGSSLLAQPMRLELGGNI